MNKEEIVNALADKTGFTKKDSEIALDAVMDIITTNMKNGVKTQIVGFGVFETQDRAARVGRNPITNEQLVIPARKVPAFKPGITLKRLIEG